MCRAPASRKPMFEDAEQIAQVHGERIHCDLVGPTRPSINDEVYAMITHDGAKGCPQTNSKAERFHRTVAEGMACLFVASGVPCVFWTFCLMAFLGVYARSPGTGGAPSPYELRFNRSFELANLRPFGTACYYLAEEHDKFASRGRPGVVLGCGRLHSYYVLDCEHYAETKGEAKMVHTRDVRFPPHLRRPFHELGMDNPDAAYWVHRTFAPNVQDPTLVAGDDGRCVLCGLWSADAEVHCRGCLLGGGRRRHVDGPGCLRGRCGGHAFLDAQGSSGPADGDTSINYSPSSHDGCLCGATNWTFFAQHPLMPPV